MKMQDPTENIRQQQPGQFRRLEDGSEPFVYMNAQKVRSAKDQEKGSVYVRDQSVVTLEKDKSSDLPKLFDTDAGSKLIAEKIRSAYRPADNDQEVFQKYDKSGKAETATKPERIIDQLA